MFKAIGDALSGLEIWTESIEIRLCLQRQCVSIYDETTIIYKDGDLTLNKYLQSAENRAGFKRLSHVIHSQNLTYFKRII